jgi:hypothetical protein
MTAAEGDVHSRNSTPCHLLPLWAISIPATAAQLRSTYIPTPKEVHQPHANDSCHQAIVPAKLVHQKVSLLAA